MGTQTSRRRELAEMNETALLSALAEAKQELFNLRFQFATGQLENSARIGDVKREVARILTFIRAKEIAAAEAEVA
jgi:large subunit ribosomal protein L29